MSETVVRSRSCGLKDIYLAKVEENTPLSYKAAVPVKFARAIKAKITHKFTTEKVYSDDGIEDVVNNYEGTDIELEVNNLAPQDRALVWDQLFENGFLVSSAEDRPPELALGFRMRQANGKYEFVWHYCGRFDQGQDEEYGTIDSKKNLMTKTIKGSFYERQKTDTVQKSNGTTEEKHLYRISVDESNLAQTAADAATAIRNWFQEVQERPTAAAANNGG